MSRARLAGAVLALVLGATTTPALGALTPASADGASCTTTTSISVYATTLVYGGYDRVQGAVAAQCAGGTGTPPTAPRADAGTTVVERSLDAGASWQVVGGGTSSSNARWSGDGVVRATALVRVRYTGGTSASTGDSFAGSQSAPVRIAVIRALAVKDRSGPTTSVGRFRLTPTTGLVHHRLALQVREGGRWKRYTKVRLRANGVFRVTFASSRRGIRYRLVVPAAGGLSGHIYGPFIASRV